MTEELQLKSIELAELRELLDLEKIRKVIQFYSQLMDGRDFAGRSRLYTEDAIVEWGPYGTCHGREAIRERLIASHPGRLPYDGFHCTTNEWIELVGPEAAVSRNYLTDIWPIPADAPRGPITHSGYPENPVVLYADYENEYRKVGREWQISKSAIEFVWPERIVSKAFPRLMGLHT